MLPVLPADFDDQARQGQHCNQVGDHHQSVEEVGEIPYQLHLLQRTEQHTEYNANAVNGQGLLTKQGLEVDLAEEVPANDGGESEEQQAYTAQ